MVNLKFNKKGIVKNKNSGITLISLVVTIIVLLILAGISISMLSGDNGLLKRAGDARDDTVIGQEKEQVELAYISAAVKKLGDNVDKDDLQDELDLSVGENKTIVTGSGTLKVKFEDTKNEYVVSQNGTVAKYKEPDPITLEEAKLNEKKFEDKTILLDIYKNKVVVPKGFKVAQDSGESVKEGVVIEDTIGNQYVWIPVSNINHDGSNKIKISNTEEIEITLGRYLFDSTGNLSSTSGEYQYGLDYENTVVLDGVYQELSEYHETSELSATTRNNTTAKNLKDFIESVRDNNGYYVARYEASYRENGKAGSKISTGTPATSLPSSREEGQLWNWITQSEASIACQNLYETVNSDLMNSYSWDTALLFIQSAGNLNYSNQRSKNFSSSSASNTGVNDDEVCNINDIASNCREWTTEYSSDEFVYRNETRFKPAVSRGGYFYSGGHSSRSRETAVVTDVGSSGYGYYSFRSILYLY